MIHCLHPETPPLNLPEACRYAGCPGADGETAEQLRRLWEEAESLCRYGICYTLLSVACTDNGIRLGDWEISSLSLRRALEGCDRALLFAATIGVGFDRLLQRYAVTSPAKAAVLQGIGTERIESLCDAFCRAHDLELVAEGSTLRPRVSPGYGDIPLVLQKDIFPLLDCPRQLGLALNESLLMSPSKSVTAIAGIWTGSKVCHAPKGCAVCGKADCAFRKP